MSGLDLSIVASILSDAQTAVSIAIERVNQPTAAEKRTMKQLESLISRARDLSEGVTEKQCECGNLFTVTAGSEEDWCPQCRAYEAAGGNLDGCRAAFGSWVSLTTHSITPKGR